MGGWVVEQEEEEGPLGVTWKKAGAWEGLVILRRGKPVVSLFWVGGWVSGGGGRDVKEDRGERDGLNELRLTYRASQVEHRS